MHLVIVLIAVGLLGLAALVAAGKFGQMQSEPIRDQYQPPVNDGPLTAESLKEVRFAVSPMGYDMAQVDEFLARVARDLDGAERTPDPAPEPTTAADEPQIVPATSARRGLPPVDDGPSESDTGSEAQSTDPTRPARAFDDGDGSAAWAPRG